MIRQIALLLILLSLLKSSFQKTCVNIWESDFENKDINLCPVATVSGEFCYFPFTYNGYTYWTCKPNNFVNFPQCLTTSGIWSECILPTNAIVSRVIYHLNTSPGTFSVSQNGGSIIYIIGRGFVNNAYSFPPTTTRSNEVYLTNDFNSYSCQVDPYKTTSTLISCYLPALLPGKYLVRVKVNGELIPLYQYENIEYAYFYATYWYTPIFYEILPMSSTPGTFLGIYGDFKTNCFRMDEYYCSENQPRINRVDIGDQKCNLIDPATNSPYESVSPYGFKCKLDGTKIDFFNVSISVFEYGRALPEKNSYLVSPDERIYNFRTYPEILSISPSNGSLEGGTYLTIIGSYFFHDENQPALINIGGSPCNVVNYEKNNGYDSKLVCLTSPKPTNMNDQIGGRGITLIKENFFTSFENIQSAQPSSSASITLLDKASYRSTSYEAVTIWLRGYFVAAKSSNYKFEINSNSYGFFFISDDETSKSKSLFFTFGDKNNNNGTKYLQGGRKYYIEAVSSRQYDILTLTINAIMLDTYLSETLIISNVVKNHIQEIEISSTINEESYVITRQDNTVVDSVGEIQEITLISTLKLPFILSFDGAYTIVLDFDSIDIVIQNALNDLPSLGPDSVTVSINDSIIDPNMKKFTVTFASSFGDVPLIESGFEYDSFSVVEIQSGQSDGKNIQIIIQNQSTPLFNFYDSVKNITNLLTNSFGIRCPLSIVSPSSDEAHTYLDFEDECSEIERPLDEVAFCGKCSMKRHWIQIYPNSPLTFRYLCFAYKTNKVFIYISMGVSYLSNLYTRSFKLDSIGDSQWHYTCIDLHIDIFSSFPKISSFLFSVYIQLNSLQDQTDYYLDALSIRKQPPEDYEYLTLINKRRIFPSLNIYPSSLNILKNGDALSIRFKPVNCSNNLNLFTIRQDNSGIYDIKRISEASPPVSGSFELSWNGKNIFVPANLSEQELRNLLEANNFGRVSVQRTKDCYGYKWKILWIDGGDRSNLTISNSELYGNNPVINTSKIQDGGVRFYPLLDDILRTHHSKAQVSVLINNIVANCSNSCDFEWLESSTPEVTSIDTSNRRSIFITGSGFETNLLKNIVLIGETNCVVNSATSTQLTCIPDHGPIGVYNFTVNVLGKGLAKMRTNAIFQFELNATDFNPKISGVGGGVTITITGFGFTRQTLITIDSNECKYVSHKFNSICCIVPSNPTLTNKQVDVVLQDFGRTITLTQKLSYDYLKTPRVLSINPSILSVLGGEIINITGSNFPVPLKFIRIGSNRVNLISSSSTLIQIISPNLDPGLYDLIIETESLGNAFVNKKLEYQFFISSIRPNIGSIRGGSLVDIEGGGFSSNCSLNRVLFGIYKCDVQSCSETKISCITSSVHTSYEITNDGYDKDYGFRYAWNNSYLTIQKEEFVSWSWQPPNAIKGLKFKVEETKYPYDTTASGFKSGEQTEFGSFKYQFMHAGFYYYWSGLVKQNISFRGVVEVLDRKLEEKVLAVEVFLNNKKAQKCVFPFVYKGVEYSECTEIDRGFDWCSPSRIYSGQFIRCTTSLSPTTNCSSRNIDISACTDSTHPPLNYFKFTHCKTAQITNVYPLTIDYNTVLTIEGNGFSTIQCENKVLIDGVVCQIETSSATSITCKIGENSGLVPNKLYGFELLINNIGYALQAEFYQILFISVIDSIQPIEGSTAGGNKVIIKGDGFTVDTIINFGLDFYYSSTADITYNQITLITKPTIGFVNLTIFSNLGQATCKCECTYEFKSNIAPIINTVHPLSINDSTEIKITGENFINDTSLIKVKIGSQICEVSTTITTEIKCNIPGLDLGSQNISLNIDPYGNAIETNVKIVGIASLKSINPTSGSIYGGTRVIILGNGFTKSTLVSIGNSKCQPVSIKINQIECITSSNLAQNLYLLKVYDGNFVFPNTNVFYSYNTSMTPVINSISPKIKIISTNELTIIGTGFSTDLSKIKVIIGSSECNVLSTNETQIKCRLGLNHPGVYPICLHIDPKGYAANDTKIQYNLIVSNISKTQSGVAGGIDLEIDVYEFSNRTKVFICDSECKQTGSSANNRKNCIVPKSKNQNQDTTCDLVIIENDLYFNSTFNYIKSITSELLSVSPVRGGTGGGTLLSINGRNIPSDSITNVKVLIAGIECNIISLTPTQIQCTTNSYSQSSIKALIEVYINGIGLAINNDVYFEYVDLWSSRFTWGGNEPPLEGDLVVISQSQTVYLDVVTPILKGIIIMGGNLIFDDNQDVHLRAEFIIILNNGRLQIGTEQKPFMNKAKITMFCLNISASLPVFGSKVIGLREGTIEMHGKPVGVTWTHLGQTADSGTNKIVLKESVEWEVESEIVIATTGDHLSQGESEVRKILGISFDKRTLTLDRALTYTHLSVIRTVGSGKNTRRIEIRAEVGLLTRNIVFQGDNHETLSQVKSEFGDQTNWLNRYGNEIVVNEFGSTIMVYGDIEKQKLRETVFLKLSNVELFNVGQTFEKGSYPIHFLFSGDMPSSYIRECAIHKSFNRGINIQGTNYITVEKNVIYNIEGSGYFLQDGEEIGNIFEYNLAIYIKSSSRLLNEDITPAAFWVSNPNNTFSHNSVADVSHFGFWYRLLDRPSFYSLDHCSRKLSPLEKFFNNTVHAVGRFGLWIFPGYYPSTSCYYGYPTVAKFEHFTTYNNVKGAEWVQSNFLQFRNFISFDHASASIEAHQINYNQNHMYYYLLVLYNESFTPLISDSIVIGYSNSSANATITPNGLVVPLSRGLFVKNTSFYNFPDQKSQAIMASSDVSSCSHGCGGWTTRFSGLSFSNVMHRTMHRWDSDFIGQDLDGSLSGLVNGYVVATNKFTLSNPNCEEKSIFKNGSVCKTNDWTPFTFSTSYYGEINITNSKNATVTVSRSSYGYMIALEVNQEYLFDLTQPFYFTSYSNFFGFDGVFYNLYPDQYVILKFKMKIKPERIFGSFSLNESMKALDANSNDGDWHWNENTKILSLIFSNKIKTLPVLDLSFYLYIYICQNDNCRLPETENLKIPVTKRPDNALFWSNISTWKFSEPGWGGYASNGNFRLPIEGENVKIPHNIYVVVDCPIPKLKILQVNGVLEFDNGLDHKLEADVIFIDGGQLILGWEKDPILTNVEIILNGQKDMLDYKLPNQIDSIGVKVIGVYGGLDIHGRPIQKAWTTLQKTAYKGTNNIALNDPVDWLIGDSIVITTTSYIVNQSEVFNILEKSSDNKTLILSSSLQHEHLAYIETFEDSTSYKVNAAVGLLSRNVKIFGSEYTNQEKDLFGFRIIVSDNITTHNNKPYNKRAFARLSNIELVRSGQFSRKSGEAKRHGILFSNLGDYNYSIPSYVNNCVFRNGYSAAVGILGSASIPITNNVIYHTIDYGIYLEGHSNIIRHNLIVSNRWIPSLWPSQITSEISYMGAIDMHEADSAVIEDNFIVGSERIGLLYNGDTCKGYNFPQNLNHSIKNNLVYSSITAVAILPTHTFNYDCVKISGFTIFKSSHWGIYYQNTQTIYIESNILIDNQINIFTQVITPNILDHSISNKRAFIFDNIIVGQSPSFNCLTDVKSSDLYFVRAGSVASYTAGPTNNSKVGITWAQFMSGSNKAPNKPWANIMTYNSLDGLMILDRNIFAHFGTKCNSQIDFVISSNKRNDDGHHPIVIKNSKLFNVEHQSKIWIHRPNIQKINPYDCVDMDCDGLKKNLLTDEDGSFLGSKGSVIAQSEFEWGNQQRGLGDYRIPKEALESANGSILQTNEVYSHLGIVREDDKCFFRSSWQAYECHNIEYKMLLIESMDPDTETRRISPVAIISDNKYLDLINGPQDHSWCFAISCRKRVSSFMAIVAGSRSYDIYLSSKAPKQLRLRLINSDPEFKIRISIYYFSSNRIDVYKNETFILPTNGYYQEGRMMFNATAKNLDLFMPTVNSQSGTNLVVREHRKVYATISGSDYLDFKIAPAVVLKFGVPTTTPEEFFNEKNIVKKFADLLGIDPIRIRQVNIIREKKRKRQTDTNIYFDLVIFDNPSNQSSFNNYDEQSTGSLEELSANVTNLYTTGQLQQMAADILNISLLALTVERPMANSSAEIKKLNKISVIREASACREQSPCQVQPIIALLDDNNENVIGLESDTNPWKIKASLISTTNPKSELIYEREVVVQNNGFVLFKNLGISDITNSFIVKYELIPPIGIVISTVRDINQTSQSCTVAELNLSTLDENIIVDSNETFNLTFAIIDKYTENRIKNISWRNHKWQASAKLYALPKSLTNGILGSTSNLIQVDTETSSVCLLDLYLNSNGMYLIEIIIRSTDNEYFMKLLSKGIIVSEKIKALGVTEEPVLFLTFNKDITTDKNKIEIYKAIIYNSFIHKFNLTMTRAINFYDSFYVNLGISLDSNIAGLKNDLNNGFILDNGINLTHAILNDEVLNIKSKTDTVVLNIDPNLPNPATTKENTSFRVKADLTIIIGFLSIFIAFNKAFF